MLTWGDQNVTKLDEYLTTEELAALTKIPAETLRWWRRRGDGPRSERLGRHVRYPLSEVRAWLADPQGYQAARDVEIP